MTPDSPLRQSKKILRIFVSSPGDVQEERLKARQVVETLQRHYGRDTLLKEVMWEDLALSVDESAQQSIEKRLTGEDGVDVAVFILWSRLGSELNEVATPRPGGGAYRSGTEHEFDLMLRARAATGGKMPHILAYFRDDEKGFLENLKNLDPLRYPDALRQREMARQFVQERFMDEKGRNIRGLHLFAEPVSFARRLHSHLKQVIDELLGYGEKWVKWTESPYRGLEVFEIEHAAIFHGRDEEVHEVLDRMRARETEGCAFLVIVGASGSGKSSLARAGVAATLQQRSFDERVKEWRVATFLPSLQMADLFIGMARLLGEVVPELHHGAGGLERLAERFRSVPEAGMDLCETAMNQATRVAGGRVKVLLVVDQMEELWTDAAIGESREGFIRLLGAMAASGCFWILGTLRSDFFPEMQASEGLMQLRGSYGQFDLVAPRSAGLQSLIVEPARMAGICFERDERTGATLDHRILEDALLSPEALPLLQFALAELYERRDEKERMLTFAAYNAMGGVEGALGERATAVFSRLPEFARNCLDEVLPLLVSIETLGEERPVRRRAPLRELCATPARKELVDALIRARFLTTEGQGDEPTASLTHEALLRRWDRIRQWLERNRDLLRMRGVAEQTMARWEASGRDDSLLLSTGLPIEEGRRLIAVGRGLISKELDDFIKASVRFREGEEKIRRRRRGVVMMALSGLTALAVVAAVTAISRERDADLARDEALAAERFAKVARMDLLQANAEQAEREGRLPEAIAWLQEGYRQKGEDDPSKMVDQERALFLSAQADHYRWRIPGAGREAERMVDCVPHGVAFVLMGDGDLVRIDRSSERDWVWELAAIGGERPVDIAGNDEGDVIYVLENSRIRAIDAVNLRDRWTYESQGDGFGDVFWKSPEGLLWCEESGNLVALDPKLGEVRSRYAMPFEAGTGIYELVVDEDRGVAAVRINQGGAMRLSIWSLKDSTVLLDEERWVGVGKCLGLQGGRLAMVSRDESSKRGRLRLVDLNMVDTPLEIETPWMLNGLGRLSPNGVEVCCDDGRLRRFGWDGTMGEIIEPPTPDPLFLASGGDDRMWLFSTSGVQVREDGKWTRELALGRHVVDAVDWDEDSVLLLTREGIEWRSLADGSIEKRCDVLLDEIAISEDATILIGRRGDILMRLDARRMFESGVAGEPMVRVAGANPGRMIVLKNAGVVLAATEDGYFAFDLETLARREKVEEAGPGAYGNIGDSGSILARFDKASSMLKLAGYGVLIPRTSGRSVGLAISESEVTCIAMGDENDVIGLANGSVMRLTIPQEALVLEYSLNEEGELERVEDPESSEALAEIVPPGGEAVTGIAFLPGGELMILRSSGELSVYRESLGGEFVYSRALAASAERIWQLKSGDVLFSAADGQLGLVSDFGLSARADRVDSVISGASGGAKAIRHGPALLVPERRSVHAWDGGKSNARFDSARVATSAIFLGIQANPSGNAVVATDGSQIILWASRDASQPIFGQTANPYRATLDFALAKRNCVRFLDDRRLVAVAKGVIAVAELKNEKGVSLTLVKQWVPTFPDEPEFDQCAATERIIALGSESKDLRALYFLDPSDGSTGMMLLPQVPRCMEVVDRDRDWFLAGGGNGEAYLIDGANRKILRTFHVGTSTGDGYNYYVRSATRVADTDTLCLGGKDCIFLVDLITGQVFGRVPTKGFVWSISNLMGSDRVYWCAEEWFGDFPIAVKRQSDGEKALDLGVMIVNGQIAAAMPKATFRRLDEIPSEKP